MIAALLVLYPSGNCFTVHGRLHDVDLDNEGVSPAILDVDGCLVLLDPRAVVLSDQTVVADPRRRDPEQLAPWVRDWLEEHPEWPRVATEAAATP